MLLHCLDLFLGRHTTYCEEGKKLSYTCTPRSKRGLLGEILKPPNIQLTHSIDTNVSSLFVFVCCTENVLFTGVNVTS